MRKRIVHIWDVPAGGALTALAVVSAAFCLGALAGMLVASQVEGGGQDSLTAYLERYLAGISELENEISLDYARHMTLSPGALRASDKK